MTRRDIEAVLSPGWPRTSEAHPLVPWCADLVARAGLTVTYGTRFSARARVGHIEVPSSLDNDEDVACLLHEAGHCADPRVRPHLAEDHMLPQDFAVSLPSECFAWLWAFSAAGRRWTPAMQAHLSMCLGGYAAAYGEAADWPVVHGVIAYTLAICRRREVVALRPRPPLPVPLVIRDLVEDVLLVTAGRFE